jgi:hypothetical protein
MPFEPIGYVAPLVVVEYVDDALTGAANHFRVVL